MSHSHGLSGLLAVSALIVAITPLAANAQEALDQRVAALPLTILERGTSGSAELGVLFDPSKPGSVFEKNVVMAALGGGLGAGSLSVTGGPVERRGIVSLSKSG